MTPPHPQTIKIIPDRPALQVTSLFDFCDAAGSLPPTVIVSVLPNDDDAALLADSLGARHAPIDIHQSLQSPDISALKVSILSLIAFSQSLSRKDRVLFYGNTGHSNSSGALLVVDIAWSRYNVRPLDEDAISSAVTRLKQANPNALPSLLLLSLADRMFGLNGKLVSARMSWRSSQPSH